MSGIITKRRFAQLIKGCSDVNKLGALYNSSKIELAFPDKTKRRKVVFDTLNGGANKPKLLDAFLNRFPEETD